MLFPRSATGLLLCALLALAGAPAVPAADGSAPGRVAAPVPAAPRPARPHPHVTARPPLQAIPATPGGAGTVQQRMRQCNAQADARKLRDAPREAFVRNCMSTHRVRQRASRPAESQHNP